MADLGEEQFV